MVDIFLELPDDLSADLEREAAVEGLSLEEHIRSLLIANRPNPPQTIRNAKGPLEDESIVRAAAIESEYQKLGYSYGWRFITCPERNADSAKLLLVSLNPAGREKHGPAWSQENGSAYLVEAWGDQTVGAAKLQRQVQSMFALLDLSQEAVFSAHYVPFRSPSWDALDRRDEAEAFAKGLWQWLKPKLSFERIVCIGKDVPARPIATLFGAKLEGSFPVGWGAVTADRYRLPDGRPLIALPHLSRFTIFGRAEGKASLRTLFELDAL